MDICYDDILSDHKGPKVLQRPAVVQEHVHDQTAPMPAANQQAVRTWISRGIALQTLHTTSATADAKK